MEERERWGGGRQTEQIDRKAVMSCLRQLDRTEVERGERGEVEREYEKDRERKKTKHNYLISENAFTQHYAFIIKISHCYNTFPDAKS